MELCEPWLTPSDLCVSEAQMEDEQFAAWVNNSIDTSTEWVFHATGSHWSICETGIRIERSCIHEAPLSCQCPMRWRRIDLTRYVQGPILSAVVMVDGEVVDPSLYRIDSRRYLTPQAVPGGENPLTPWPAQYMNRPDGAVGTWSVIVTHGPGVPSPLLDAAADLGKNLLLRCQGDRECALPTNATSISRDGMSIQLEVPKDGLTGIPFVDSAVARFPRPVESASRIFDPAAPRAALTML